LKNTNKFKVQTSTVILITVYLFLSGCSVQKQLMPIGGSRADGTIKLGYEYGAFESPKLDSAQGDSAAKQKCVAWGYNDAEAFGSYTKTCSRPTRSGCMGWNVTVEYQCKGSLEK
jgi:hypothetical protein